MSMENRDRLVDETKRGVADQLAAERGAHHLTVDALASRVGMNRKTVMRFESGERSPDVQQLAWLCRAFGLTLGEFMRRAQERIDHAREHPGDESQVSSG